MRLVESERAAAVVVSLAENYAAKHTQRWHDDDGGGIESVCGSSAIVIAWYFQNFSFATKGADATKAAVTLTAASCHH